MRLFIIMKIFTPFLYIDKMWGVMRKATFPDKMCF